MRVPFLHQKKTDLVYPWLTAYAVVLVILSFILLTVSLWNTFVAFDVLSPIRR